MPTTSRADESSRPLLGHHHDANSEVFASRQSHLQSSTQDDEDSRTSRLRWFLSSRKKHYIVIGLVTLDVAALLANIFVELVECDAKHGESPGSWVTPVRETLSTAGLVFSCLFMAELILDVSAFGLEYFEDWFHCLDAVVIVISLVFDLLSNGIVEEIGSLVIIFRLFRLVKVVEEVSLGAAVQMESMDLEMQKLREQNDELKERLDRQQP